MSERPARERERKSHENRTIAPAKITLLYESRDGKLCLFQDAQGHLTAVRSSQLA